MSSTYPHKAHSFSLNPSNCPAPGVGCALNHCHTREEQVQVGSWNSWVLEKKGEWGLYSGCSKRWAVRGIWDRKAGRDNEAGGIWSRCGLHSLALCWVTLGKFLSLLRFDFHMELCIETNGVGLPSSLTPVCWGCWAKLWLGPGEALRDDYSEHLCCDADPHPTNMHEAMLLLLLLWDRVHGAIIFFPHLSPEERSDAWW